MNKRAVLLFPALAVGLMVSAQAASASGSPTAPAGTAPGASEQTPGGTPEAAMFGTGPSGTGAVIPACPVLTYVNFDNLTCVPTSTPLPPQTLPLATNVACPVDGDLEGSEGAPTFTQPSDMKTLLECILPTAVQWMSWEYGGLDVPAAWATSQATSLLPNNFVYVPTGVDVQSNE